MEAFTRLTSRVVPLTVRDVDTDQIIPARFLKGTDKSGLGVRLFYDWRYDAQGRPHADFVLNQPRVAGAQVLLAGHNFGCGSSREHAPWALLDFGFRAVISTSFADIFRGNALKNGLLPVAVDARAHAALLARVTEDANAQVSIDLASQSLTLPDGSAVSFPMDSFSKQCLLLGVDQLGYILQHADKITSFEQQHSH